MSRLQRAIIGSYFLSLGYCLAWIPWHIPFRWPTDLARPIGYYNAGYGWLWYGPHSVVDNFYRGEFAQPNIPLIELRVALATALFAALFVITFSRRLN